jgi:acetyl-CoA acetyltransferase
MYAYIYVYTNGEFFNFCMIIISSGAFLGFAIGGCEPDEMGIGPIIAIPKLLKTHNLKVQDIDLWEINEAFAVVPLYTAEKLGINPFMNMNALIAEHLLNVN